ncbi:UNVERIFIED_CONTAM: hypothetical protein GTU68_025485 [Idotea baltica]|nr:hypothetical protein [Idotea baltica]
MAQTLTVLGLESSCDDTAAAVVRQSGVDRAEILSSIVYGQTELHSAYGGVVPELAARAHAEKLDQCVRDALSAADLTLAELDAVAVTAGPGLIGGVMSGVMCAKGICAATGLPLVGINHLAGHALTPRLTDAISFPYLMLLVSGGHCQYLLVRAPDDFTRLGGTIDDAPGEAFDKTARLLGLPQPGGPRYQAEGHRDPRRFRFPSPCCYSRIDCNLRSRSENPLLRQRTSDCCRTRMITRRTVHMSRRFSCRRQRIWRKKTRRALRILSPRVLSGQHWPLMARCRTPHPNAP